MARSAVSTGARSTGGCAEPRWLRRAPSAASPRRWRRPPVQEAPRGGLQALADGTASPTTPTPRSVRTVCTRVRATRRGFRAQDGVATPVQWGKTPSRGANPRPEGHDGHLSEEASPGLTHGLTRLIPRPRTCGCAAGLRTCARVVDVPPGRVHNEASPARRRSRRRGASPRGRRGWDREAWAGLMAPDFITPILALSQRKPAVRPTRCVRGPRCPISESRRGFALPLQRKPRVRPTRNVRG